MNEYLIDLKNAFKAVSQTFYNTPAYNRRGGIILQEPEDNFCAEIIHRFNNIKESTERRNSYNGLRIDFNLMKNRFNIQPDIVLHSGGDNQNRQEIYIEVKTYRYSDLEGDLNKLRIAISTDLNFNRAVMLVINKELHSTITDIEAFIQESHLREAELQKLFLYHGKCIANNLIQYSFCSFNNLNNPINE